MYDRYEQTKLSFISLIISILRVILKISNTKGVNQMTGTIIGIRKTSRGTIVYISQKMTEIEGVASGCCCYTAWLGTNICSFTVGETVYLSKPFKGWVEISKLTKG